MLDALLIQPLLMIYAGIIDMMPAWMGLGTRLIMFSMVLNLLLLPVYYQMEKNFRDAHAVRDCVNRDVARMKRHFRGRELYFYTRTVYRQHQYHPISALLGSGDLLLQVLIFATVYRLLSQPGVMSGHVYSIISDLGQPDRLLGGVNLLPLLMTAINAASVLAYVDDQRKRIQALVLSVVFLVLLYRSPAGLVLYWTANNLFSLCRSLVQRRLLHQLPGWLRGCAIHVASQR